MRLEDSEEIERRLIEILGPERVLKDRSKTKEYASGESVTFPGVSDHWRYAGNFDFDSYYWPDFVALPDSTEQISAILKLANEKRIPIVPWGGGTSSHGSTLPIHGGIVIDLRKMDRILDIDKEELTVTAQAGITLLELQYLLNEEGLCHGTNPASAAWVTLGGSLCCETHTIAGYEYGTTVDNILGLVAVIPSGEVIRTRSRYWGGYNLNQLFTRSEGTLGIVTEIKMRVNLKPEYSRNIGFVFDSFEEAVLTQNGILKNVSPFPGMMTIYDGYRVPDLFQYVGPRLSDILQKDGGLLLMTLEGHKEIVDIEEKKVRTIIDGNHGKELGGKAADLAEDWWTVMVGGRIKKYEAAQKGQIGSSRVGPHIWVPKSLSVWSRNTFKELAQKYGIKYAGCMNYPTRQGVLATVDQSKPEEVQAYRKMIREYATLVREKGGSIMGAHGCGFTFNEELRAELQNGFRVMEKIKTALDPNGIMNPGKLFQ